MTTLTFNWVAAENEGTGEIGLSIQNSLSDGFDPVHVEHSNIERANPGALVSACKFMLHDMLEHNPMLGSNPFENELCALGATQHTRPNEIDWNGLEGDISYLTGDFLLDLSEYDAEEEDIQEALDSFVSNNFTLESGDMPFHWDMKRLAQKVLSGRSDSLSEEQSELLASRISGWMVVGYEDAKERFERQYQGFFTDLSYELRDEVLDVLDSMESFGLETWEEGHSFTVEIDLENYGVSMKWDEQAEWEAERDAYEED